MSESLRDLLDRLYAFALGERGGAFVQAALLFLLGIFVSRFVGRAVGRLLRNRMGLQGVILARRLTTYTLLVLFAVSALHTAGFDLTVLLGAAGVLTVALGFASQTSVSNLISGLFLIGERAFEIGESVEIGTIRGEIIAIDWMSVKIRTFDNLMVRLPNETVLKSQITNMSRFPIRRLDQPLSVAYGSDLDQVRDVLNQVIDDHPMCLDEPKPVLFHKGFGDSAILLQLSVWILTPNFLEMKNKLPQEIATAFEAAGIEIPFPQRTLTFRDAPPTPPTVESSDSVAD